LIDCLMLNANLISISAIYRGVNKLYVLT